jgi:glycosyltransferase involved in cell wall biosynthesis
LNLLVFNLGMDAAHSTLGHTTAWTNELARRCEHVSVITMFTGEVAVDDNVTVHSLGKELGRSEPQRLAAFYRLVWRVLEERPITACFAHMAPLFTVLFAPIARVRRVPILLWYAHTSVSPTLRAAHALAQRCVTATPASFRLRSDKLFAVGHGIDVERFAPPSETGASYATTAISAGRITPIKGLEEMIEAIAVLEQERGLDLRLELVGAPATPVDEVYRARLERTVASLGVQDSVRFAGPVPYGAMPQRYHRASLSLNLSGGAMDKAILESMAAGCLPVSRNPAFAALARAHGLEWLVPAAGARALADCIAVAQGQRGDVRGALAERLRDIVVREHSLSTLADRLIAHLTELAERARPLSVRRGRRRRPTRTRP